MELAFNSVELGVHVAVEDGGRNGGLDRVRLPSLGVALLLVVHVDAGLDLFQVGLEVAELSGGLTLSNGLTGTTDERHCLFVLFVLCFCFC